MGCNTSANKESTTQFNIPVPKVLKFKSFKFIESEYDHLSKLIQDLKLKSNVNSTLVNKLCELIKEKGNCFTRNDSDIGHCSAVKHRIDIEKNAPCQQKFYKVPLALEDEVEKEVKKLLDNGIIRESQSDWNSPLVVVKKKNGKLRLCVDYRKLNAVTLKPNYYIPSASEIFDNLSGAKVFSCLDLSSAYYHCEILEEHKYLTAFSTKLGKFEFQRMPFGLCGAPFTFQKMMCNILKENLWKNVMVYLDDVIVYSKNMDEHIQQLRDIFNKIEKAHLKLSPDKCKFGVEEVKFLGHNISSKGISTDPDKIKALVEYEKPKTTKELQSFLGLANYYRKFIKNYSEEVKSLENLVKQYGKDRAITWNYEEEIVFQNIKKLLCEAPILGFPEKDCQFTLDTDASHDTIGCVLSQLQNGKEVVIAYGSRKLSNSEKAYCITRKELLAVYYFVKYFKHYLLGRHFIIRTDHRALTWLLDWQKPSTAQYCNWIAELECYDFEIQHRQGNLHVNADFFSRLYCEQCELSHNEPKGKTNVKKDVYSRTNIIQIDEKTNERQNILRKYHEDLGHIGCNKMISLIKRYFRWPNLEKDVRDYIANCIHCAERKTPKIENRGNVKITATDIFEKIMIDIAGPLPPSRSGHRYILAATDVFSRFVILIPVRQITTKSLIDILKIRIFSLFGYPENIISDGAKCFDSEEFKEFCQLHSISYSTTSPYHPQSNGIVERHFRTIKDMLYATTQSEGINWEDALPRIEIGLRATINNGIKQVPYEVVFGKIPNLPLNTTCKIKQSERLKKREIVRNECKLNNHSADVKNIFNVGDKVMVRTYIAKVGIDKKRYEGPGSIIAIVNPKSYLIKIGSTIKRRHESALKLFRGKYSTKKDTSIGSRETSIISKGSKRNKIRPPNELVTTGNVAKIHTRRYIDNVGQITENEEEAPVRRYPDRVKKSVSKYGFKGGNVM